MNPSLDLVRPPYTDWDEGGKIMARARHAFRIQVDPNRGLFFDEDNENSGAASSSKGQ